MQWTELARRKGKVESYLVQNFHVWHTDGDKDQDDLQVAVRCFQYKNKDPASGKGELTP